MRMVVTFASLSADLAVLGTRVPQGAVPGANAIEIIQMKELEECIVDTTARNVSVVQGDKVARPTFAV